VRFLTSILKIFSSFRTKQSGDDQALKVGLERYEQRLDSGELGKPELDRVLKRVVAKAERPPFPRETVERFVQELAARKTKARAFVGVEDKQRYVAVVADHREQLPLVSAAYQEVVRAFERPQFELLLYVIDDFKGVKPESAFTEERLFTELKVS